MNRKSTIDRIIATRQSKQAELQSKHQAISDISDALEALKKQSQELQTKMPDDIVTCRKLQEVSAKLTEAETKAKTLNKELRILKERAGRSTLNIGIVGVPKQGKSTFLQALTGLDEATIPTGNDYVTGACSYLRHDPNVPAGDAYAIITPYTEQEFLFEVIKPFCNIFKLDITSVSELPYLDLPDNSNMLETNKRILERLEHLKADYDEYKRWLGQPSFRIEKNQIRQFVAQCDEYCSVKYTNWYAIKKAEIHCRFPQEDIGNVMICDTPGLGDFTPSAKKALLEKLGADMDVIFFLKRLTTGDQTISERDTEFHDVVKEANPLFDVRDWAYMILNCGNGDTPEAFFLENLRTKLPTRQGVHCIDCKQTEEVSRGVDSILSDIVYQIPTLDEKLMRSYYTQVNELKLVLDSVKDCARRVFPGANGAGSTIDIGNKVDDIIDSVFSEFNKLKKELGSGTGSIAADLEGIINKMRGNTPALEYSEFDASQPGKWFMEGKDKLRAQFLADFSNLDDILESMFSQVRDKLASILMSENGGRLAFVTEGEEDACFWSALKELLLLDFGDNAQHIIKGIDNMLGFKMSFRAFILPRITKITKVLSNEPLHDDSELSRFAFTPSDDISVCKNKLVSAWSYTAATCEDQFDEEEGELRDINTTPAEAMKALIDEFFLLAYKYQGERYARRIWEGFYKAHANEIWQDKNANSHQALARRWNNAVNTFTGSTEKLG